MSIAGHSEVCVQPYPGPGGKWQISTDGGTEPVWNPSPDGQRFLMLKSSESAQTTPTQINVVLNWFEELKQKVPTGKK